MKKTVLIIVMTTLIASFLTAIPQKGLHDTWDMLLKKHVLSGKVNYKGFQKDIGKFNTYLQKLDKTDISNFSQMQKLAFWINAYNAYTIKLVLNHYPIKSIRDIQRPFKQKICKVVGKVMDLDFIEHQILRKEFNVPRINFAITSASIGSPDLQSFAFKASMLDAQLGSATKRFFGSERHFKVIPNEEYGRYIRIQISEIFKRFGDDFGPKPKDWTDFIYNYAEGENLHLLKRPENIKVKYLKFNWDLNER